MPNETRDVSAAAPEAVERFIARWQAASGSELANYQLFVGELCALLELPHPEPSREDTRDNAYVFQRRVTFRHGDGTETPGFLDCYRRGAFVLEAKKLRQVAGKGFDDAMQRARGQAESYARALPAWEGRPPFLVVVDVGNAIELYAEFSRSGATYTPFPDPRSRQGRAPALARHSPGAGGRRRPGALRRPRPPHRGADRRTLRRPRPLEEAPAPATRNPGRPGPGADRRQPLRRHVAL